MNFGRLLRSVRKIPVIGYRPTSNVHEAEATVKLWIDEDHKLGQKFVRRGLHEFSCDNKGHVIVTIGEYSVGGPSGVWRHGVSLYWGPENPLNWIDNISHTPLGVTLRKRVAWESCVGLSLQYSRELNMKAIRTAAEIARYAGIDCLTITTTNYNIINAFNSVDHVGSLLHSYKQGVSSVARKNWYTMVSLSGIKVFICRLEHMDTKARQEAIKGQSSSMLKKFGSKKEVAPITHELIERSNNILSKVHIYEDLDGSKKSDNIFELRKEIEQNQVWYLTRQLSSEENLKILLENRRKMGVPLIPIHDGSVTKKEEMLLIGDMASEMATESSDIMDMFDDDEYDEEDDPFLKKDSEKNLEPEFPKFMRETGENPDFLNLKDSVSDAADEAFLDDLLDDLDI